MRARADAGYSSALPHDPSSAAVALPRAGPPRFDGACGAPQLDRAVLAVPTTLHSARSAKPNDSTRTRGGPAPDNSASEARNPQQALSSPAGPLSNWTRLPGACQFALGSRPQERGNSAGALGTGARLRDSPHALTGGPGPSRNSLGTLSNWASILSPRNHHPRPAGHDGGPHQMGPPPRPARKRHPRPTGHRSATHWVGPPPCPARNHHPHPTGHHSAICRVAPPPSPARECRRCPTGHHCAIWAGRDFATGARNSAWPLGISARPARNSTGALSIRRRAPGMRGSSQGPLSNRAWAPSNRAQVRRGSKEGARRKRGWPPGNWARLPDGWQFALGDRPRERGNSAWAPGTETWLRYSPDALTGWSGPSPNSLGTLTNWAWILSPRNHHPRPAGHHGDPHRMGPPPCPARKDHPCPTGHRSAIYRVAPPPSPIPECHPCPTGHHCAIWAGWDFSTGSSNSAGALGTGARLRDSPHALTGGPGPSRNSLGTLSNWAWILSPRNHHPRPAGHHGDPHRMGPPPCPARKDHPCPTGHRSAIYRVAPPPSPIPECHPCPTGHHCAIWAGWDFATGSSNSAGALGTEARLRDSPHALTGGPGPSRNSLGTLSNWASILSPRNHHPRPAGHDGGPHQMGPPPRPARQHHPRPTGHRSATHWVGPPPCPARKDHPHPTGHHSAIYRVAPPPSPILECRRCPTGHHCGIWAGWDFATGSSNSAWPLGNLIRPARNSTGVLGPSRNSLGTLNNWAWLLRDSAGRWGVREGALCNGSVPLGDGARALNDSAQEPHDSAGEPRNQAKVPSDWSWLPRESPQALAGWAGPSRNSLGALSNWAPMRRSPAGRWSDRAGALCNGSVPLGNGARALNDPAGVPRNQARMLSYSAVPLGDGTRALRNGAGALGDLARARGPSLGLRNTSAGRRGGSDWGPGARVGGASRGGAVMPCVASTGPEGGSSPVEQGGSVLAAQGNSVSAGHRAARKCYCLMKLEAIRQNVEGCSVWKSQSSTTSCAVVTIRSMSKSCRVAAPLDSTASMTNATAVSREYAVFLWPLRADGVLIFVPFAGLSTSAAAAIPSRPPAESGWFIRTPLTFGGSGPTATSAFGSTIRPPLVVPCKALRD